MSRPAASWSLGCLGVGARGGSLLVAVRPAACLPVFLWASVQPLARAVHAHGHDINVVVLLVADG